MQQPWVTIDLASDGPPSKVSSYSKVPTPWPEAALLAAQSELRLQLFPALEARHTSESAALFRSHKIERESLDQHYAEDSSQLEARHISERDVLLNSYRYGREGLEQRFAADSSDMQSRQLNELQEFLQQNLGLHKDMIAALAQQRKQHQVVRAQQRLVLQSTF